MNGFYSDCLIAQVERIADALERIARHLDGDVVESIITVTPGPFSWDKEAGGFVHTPQDAQEAPQDAQDAQEGPQEFSSLTPTSWAPRAGAGVIVQRGRPPNRVSHCGRCGREGTRRMNHSNSCRECVHEPWWSE